MVGKLPIIVIINLNFEGCNLFFELLQKSYQWPHPIQQWAHTVCWQGLNAEGIYIPANNIAFIRRIAEFTLSDDDDKVVRLKQ